MKNRTTTDLTEFGNRELQKSEELLQALNNNRPEWLGNDVEIMFNRHSGKVFLTDENYRVGIEMNGDLHRFYSCSECGREGVAEDMDGEEQPNQFNSGENLVCPGCESNQLH